MRMLLKWYVAGISIVSLLGLAGCSTPAVKPVTTSRVCSAYASHIEQPLQIPSALPLRELPEAKNSKDGMVCFTPEDANDLLAFVQRCRANTEMANALAEAEFARQGQMQHLTKACQLAEDQAALVAELQAKTDTSLQQLQADHERETLFYQGLLILVAILGVSQ